MRFVTNTKMWNEEIRYVLTETKAITEIRNSLNRVK